MLGEVPHQGGLHGQPVRFGGVNFLHVKAAKWGTVTRLTGVIISHERGELFWRFHLQNHQNTDEITVRTLEP